MSQGATSPTAGARATAPRDDQARGHGFRLGLVRIAWGGAVLLGIGTFAARLPGHYADLQRVCSGPVCAYGQLSPQAAQSFQTLGLSLGTYALLRAGLTLTVALTFFVIGTVLAWRKAHDWLTLLVALWIVCAGTATITGAYGLGTGSTAQGHEVSAQVVNRLTEFGLCLLVFALFPTQRVVPRAAFWLLVGIGLFVAGPSPFPSSVTVLWRLSVLAGLLLAQLYHVSYVRHVLGRDQPQRHSAWTTMGISLVIGAATVLLVLAHADQSLASVALLLFYGAIIGAEVLQLSRYWWVASPVARQQTKWIAFGLAVYVTTAAVLLAPVFFLPSLGHSGSFYQTIHTLVLIMVMLILPYTVASAILRYRLWDIDRLINRALVYGSLTALLGILYAGLLIGLEGLAGRLTKEASQPLVLVVSTLAIAAVVQPLRLRVQTIIDRRFYRRRYNAEKTLAAFGAALQSEVDLEQVRQRLLRVVEETMHPAQISLWLRQPEGHPADHPTSVKIASSAAVERTRAGLASDDEDSKAQLRAGASAGK
jgi:hypothetical protein